MIAKHISMRALGKSDFAGLVTYLTDPQPTRERLGAVTVTHCEASTLKAAVAEVLATQHLNTRCQGDKTYHLLVSFPAAEQPATETLQAIEERLCAGLGLTEHQRISVLHHDTDHLHLHIAINKIHPTRYTLHEPFQSYRTLAELCTGLEEDFGLERDNHQSRQHSAASRAADLEHHAGVESLAGWIQRTCLEDLQAAPSWRALHAILSNHGLTLRPRANGLVIEAHEGTQVRASTVARDLTKAKLETRLGPFEASLEPRAQPPIKRSYQKRPVPTRIDTAALYARYQAERQDAEVRRSTAWKRLHARKARRLEAAQRAHRLRRSTLKLLGGGRLTKKLLYAQARRALRDETQTIRDQYQQARQAITRQYPRRTWADWLRHKALEGEPEALAVLRARGPGKRLTGNTLQGEGQRHPGPVAQVAHITKQGTIRYRVGTSVVRDDGTKLQVAQETPPAGLEVALRLALTCYGHRLSVHGTAEFKAQIAEAAAATRLPITFADPALEHRRQGLLRKASKWDGVHENLTPEQRAAADKYLHEQAQKHRQGLGTRKHVPYYPGSGTLTYAGTAAVAGHCLALLQGADEVQVLPVDAATARRLQRLALGTPVTITSSNAILPSKGRRR